MTEIRYRRMPQDDVAQIQQIVQEYESEPAKGLAHGVQKDAIQNGIGARVRSEGWANWEMTFEIVTIHGEPALVFWDQGTWGLTGDILSMDEIWERLSSSQLHDPDQRLGRFSSRFVSGGNEGPGMFGRGKLIFHGASRTFDIIVDSHRADDHKYIAFARRTQGNELVQFDVPLQDEAAEQFLRTETEGVLEPLRQPGTRIIILNARQEIVDAVRDSFSHSATKRSESLAAMIQETWWEIISRYNARIFIKEGSNSVQVSLIEPLLSIVEKEDQQDGVRVYEARDLGVVVGRDRYNIKKIRLFVAKNPLPEAYNDIWVQRKQMKIGTIRKGIYADYRIERKLSGYVILDAGLEALLEQAEGTTHYGIRNNATGVRQVREKLKQAIEEFQRQLGLAASSDDSEGRKRLLNSMKAVNEAAPVLGLLTQLGPGTDTPDVEIFVDELELPEPGSLRVELGDTVGPIVFGLANRAAVDFEGNFRVFAKQPGREPVPLMEIPRRLDVEQEDTIRLPGFVLDTDCYEGGQSLDIIATYYEAGTGRDLGRAARRLYIGMNPPAPPEVPVKLFVSSDFPHRDSRRLDVSESITNIRIKVTNTTACDLVVDTKMSVRQLENRMTDRMTTPLFSAFEEKLIALKAQSDRTFYVEDVVVDPEHFGAVLESVPSISERTCDLLTTVTLAEGSPELGLPRRFKLNKASVVFYVEVDPPGHSVFQEIEMAEAPEDPRQSWYEPYGDAGYKFCLNIKHSAYEFVQSRGDQAAVGFYEVEQMLRQAYRIAFSRGVFRGPAESFRDELTSTDLSVDEAARVFDAVIGAAINEMRR